MRAGARGARRVLDSPEPELGVTANCPIRVFGTELWSPRDQQELLMAGSSLLGFEVVSQSTKLTN